MIAPWTDDLDRLAALLRSRRVVVLAGAGCSTESGIPDYRSPNGTLRHRKPMTYQEFIGSDQSRARYWARSTVGWRRIRRVEPNDAHRALARLESGGVVTGIITQNVDGLHHQAGSQRVVELHGSLEAVRCLDCARCENRHGYQQRVLDANIGWKDQIDRWTGARDRPDGDVELPDAVWTDFVVPPCSTCGGILKPDVVFFGENVPARTVDEAWSLFREGEVLLVVGSSLTVYSGRRFVYRADKEGVPVVVINQGPTRADGTAALKIDARLGHLLPQLADALL